MNKYVQLFRLGNCAMGVVGLWLAAFIAAGTGLTDHLTELVMASGVVFLFMAAGNSLNDYMDRDVDRMAHPERPIPSGRIRSGHVLWLAAILFVCAFLMSLPLNPESIAIGFVAIILMLAYEWRTKRMGFIGNVSIATMTGMLFLLGGAAVGEWEVNVSIAALAALITVGREVIKDIQDMEGDLDRLTLPKRIGQKPAGLLASILLSIAVVLSIEPYLSSTLSILYLPIVVVADAIFIYSSIIHFEDPQKGQRMIKIGMIVAMFAFLVGGFR